MKRIALLALALVATTAFVVTPPAMAAEPIPQCLKVTVQGTGNRLDPQCKEKGKPGEYIEVFEENQPQTGQGTFCALTVEVGAGIYKDPQCESLGPPNEFIKVYQPPHWHINGLQLKQGASQLKLQLKGTAVLKSEVTLMAVTVECKTSISEGAAIEGNGAKQGQDKGFLTFSQCKMTVAGNSTICKVAEPINTNQTKSRLATRTGTQVKYADLFEPQQGTTFAELKFVNGSGTCPIAGTFPVKGTVAAEVSPGQTEGQEGLLNFPAPSITEVLAGGENVSTGLFLGANKATFSAGYGARLATNEKFGVFGN